MPSKSGILTVVLVGLADVAASYADEKVRVKGGTEALGDQYYSAMNIYRLGGLAVASALAKRRASLVPAVYGLIPLGIRSLANIARKVMHQEAFHGRTYGSFAQVKPEELGPSDYRSFD